MSGGLKKLTVLSSDDSAVCGPDGCLLPVNVNGAAGSAGEPGLSDAPGPAEETETADAGTE